MTLEEQIQQAYHEAHFHPEPDQRSLWARQYRRLMAEQAQHTQQRLGIIPLGQLAKQMTEVSKAHYSGNRISKIQKVVRNDDY